MIAEIINEQACKQLRKIYKRITSGKVKEKYEPKKIPKGSVFADPKALKSNLDVRKSSDLGQFQDQEELL
jgi:hypothetical protein